MQEQSVYKWSRKEKILFVLIQLFFIATISNYNDVVSGILAGGMMLCCILFNSFKEKLELIKDRRYIIWMLLFFTWIFISILTSKDIGKGIRNLDPRLPLLYFPLTIGLIRLNKEFKERALLGFAIITTLFCAVCFAWSVHRYVQSGNVDYLYSDAITDLAVQQSIYISLLVNFSIYIFCYFIFFKRVRYKLFLIPPVIFLFIMSYMLGGRTMMLVLYCFLSGFIVYYIFRRRKYIGGIAILVTIVLIAFTVLKFFPKTINRFTDFVYTNFDYKHDGPESHYSKATTPDQWNGTNFRLAAWRCGWELFKENPVVGVHLGDKKAKLFEKYKEKDFQFAIRTEKNLHNNYLDIVVSTGIIGLFLFLIAWYILPLRSAFHSKDYLSVLIIITFAIAMITEVYFDRSFGGMLFGFFISFLLTDKKNCSLIIVQV